MLSVSSIISVLISFCFCLVFDTESHELQATWNLTSPCYHLLITRSLGVWYHTPHQCWRSNPGPHAYSMGTLTAEIQTQAPLVLFSLAVSFLKTQGLLRSEKWAGRKVQMTEFWFFFWLLLTLTMDKLLNLSESQTLHLLNDAETIIFFVQLSE